MLSLSARVRPTTIRVKQIDGTIFEVHASSLDTVYSLKEQIMQIIFIPPQNLKLVFRGKILCDDLTLSFYNIQPNDIIYVAVIQPKRERPKAPQLISRIFELINQLGELTSSKYVLAVEEINRLLEHPVLKAAARINPEIQQMMDDASQAVKNSERPLSEKTLRFVAQSQDLTFAQFEATPDGYRLLQSVMDEESPPSSASDKYYDGSRGSSYTNIVYTPKISERALPNCWKKKKNVFQNTAISLTPRFSYFERTFEASPTWDSRPRNKELLREKYVNQINLLKSMGFTDEEVILQALRETGGNVQKAEQLLRKKPRPEC